MKQVTRDNLVYLAVGLSLAAFLTVDAFYADSHGRKMWLPSKFAIRAVYSTALLAYLVVQEIRKLKATLVQMLESVVLVSVVHVGIAFVFRQQINQLSGISFSFFAAFEIFLLFLLALQVVRYLKV